MSNIDYIDTADGFTIAQRKVGVRLFAYADRNWTDAVYVRNALKKYQRRYILDFVIHMDLQSIITKTAGILNIVCVDYPRDMASFLGYVDGVDRIFKQAQPTHVLVFSDYIDNDEAVYLQKKCRREQIPYEIVTHN